MDPVKSSASAALHSQHRKNKSADQQHLLGRPHQRKNAVSDGGGLTRP